MVRLIKYLIALFFISSFESKAQDFNWVGVLQKVEKSGFSRVLVSPDITSKLENGFGDIRVLDVDGKEVPYILEQESALNFNDYFIEYPVIEKKEETKWPYYTRLVIHNQKKAKISNIQLVIRNSDVSKKLKLSGSDDGKNWYVVKDLYRFHSMYSDEATSIIKIINFPLSDYEYFEILIDDWKNNPVNILKAGYFNTSVDEGKYSKVAGFEVSQLEKEEEKETIVKIAFNGRPQIDRLSFKVSGPEFYFRKAEIQLRDSILNKNNESKYVFTTLKNVIISSNSLNSFQLNSVRTNTIYLRIKNNDNEPLNMREVKVEQLNTYLVAKLEKEKEYKIVFGDKKTHRPEYDLKYFKDEIPKKLPQLTVKNITSLKIESKVDDLEEQGFHLDNIFIWVAIFLVISFLLYMVIKMLNDLKKKQ